MRFRLTRPAVVLSVVIAAIALLVTPLLAAEVTHEAANEATSSQHYVDGTVAPATNAVARIDPRDSIQERAAKHRLVLVAILTTLLGTWLLLETHAPRLRRSGRSWPDTASPFQGRAPPRLIALCA